MPDFQVSLVASVGSTFALPSLMFVNVTSMKHAEAAFFISICFFLFCEVYCNIIFDNRGVLRRNEKPCMV